MAYKPLNPVVAEVSPNLYKAAVEANLPANQQQLIEQMARTSSLAKDLLKMGEDKARKKFLTLDPIVQDNINYLYPDKKIFQAEQNLLGKAVQAGGQAISRAVNFAFSPLIGGFNVADAYNKTLATAYSTGRQVQQGKAFSKNVLKEGYDGTNSFKWDQVKQYEDKYGKAVITLARNYLDGRTAGEAIDDYGTVDAEILSAIRFSEDEPDKFKALLDELAANAQVSPGRDVAGSMVKNRKYSNVERFAWKALIGVDITTKKGKKEAKEIISRPIDAMYRIVIDPMSWIGVGTVLKATTKGIEGIKATPKEGLRFMGQKTKGEKLTDKFQFLVEKTGSADVGIDFVFKQPEVIELWDNQLGKAVKSFADATTSQEKAAVYRRVKTDFPEWANTEVITKLAQYKVFDAASASKFFKEVDDTNMLITGNVDGMTYRRNSIPVAKKYRTVTSAVHRTADAIFNPSAETAAIAKSVDNVRLGRAMDILTKVADDTENLVNPRVQELLDAEKDLSLVQKAGRMAGRTPGRILFGEDAVKTANEFRNLAGQVLNRDLADTLTFEFLNLGEEYQRTVVRNLYYAYMIRAGLKGSPKGEAAMSEILNSTFNEKAGMTAMARTEVPFFMTKFTSPYSTRADGEAVILTSKGTIHPSQMKEGVAPLPYEAILEAASTAKFEGKERWTFMTMLGGATRNKFVRAYTDFWSTFTLFPRLGTRTSIDESFFSLLTQPVNTLRSFFTTGRKGTKAMTGITGSKSSTGFKRAYWKMFPGKDITKTLPFDERVEVVQQLAEKLDTTPEMVSRELIREAIVDRFIEVYDKTLPPRVVSSIKRLMKVNPSAMDSMANSLGARTSISGKFDTEISDSMFSPSNLSKMLKDEGLKTSKVFRGYNVSKIGDLPTAQAQFDNYNLRFSYNSKNYGEYAPKKNLYVSPVAPFFRNNGLRNENDFLRARADILEQVGIKSDNDNQLFEIDNEDKLKQFLSRTSTTVAYRQQGLPDAEIARIHAENMLIDMYIAFHGGENKYNQKLFNAISDAHELLYGGPFVTTKAIKGGDLGKGTPLGDAKDAAMRKVSNSAIVELSDIEAQKAIKVANPKATGKSSSETSLLQLGPAEGDLSGKTIMLARNGKLSGKTLRPETVSQIKAANEAGAKFVVGDMPNVDTQFHDLLNELGAKYTIFHTGEKPRVAITKIGKKKEVKAAWQKAAASIEFKDFFKLTDGFRPTSGEINTRLVTEGGIKDTSPFTEGEGLGYLMSKFQNDTMELMDAQVNGLFRTPMLLAMFDNYLGRLEPYKAMLKKRYENVMLEADPFMPKKLAAMRAEDQAENKIVNTAFEQATTSMLEYVDNPAIKSNFATSIRATGRYYRATEDFYRRVYRLYTKKPLQTLYRLRLLNTGLQASGDVYTDEKGDQYVIFPTDVIVNSAINPVLKVLTGDKNFKVPSFNDIAIKLRLINPSFAPDAGQPAFSGPVAAVSLLAIKNLLRELPLLPGGIREWVKPGTEKMADAINMLALGNIGKNLDLGEALTPLLGQTILSTLKPTEMDRQKSTAAMQAISYLQAFGNGLPSNATAPEKDRYLRNIKAAASSIIVGRNALGQISPADPALRDSKGIPDFVRNSGITSFKASFWDIYNSILRNNPDNTQDAWDLALATWVGKNPGKVVYITPRNSAPMKTFINKTNQVKDWATKNNGFVNSSYKEVAWLFAPHVGEYNPDIYAWMESEGLIGNQGLETYLQDVQTSLDKEEYFGVETWEKEQLSQTTDVDMRREVIDTAEKQRKALLTSNPYLEEALIEGLNNKGTSRVRLKLLSEALASKETPIDKRLRASMQLVVSKVNEFTAMAEDPILSNNPDFSAFKAEKKAEVNAIIDEYKKTFPEIAEANRLIFRNILNTYSRDTVSAGAKYNG